MNRRFLIKPHRWVRVARVEAWTRQCGLCFWCRSEIARHEVTAEHMVPRSQGGSSQSWNISAACQPCNLAKGTLNATRFRAILKGKVARGQIRERQIIFRVNRRAEQACRRILASVGVAKGPAEIRWGQ